MTELTLEPGDRVEVKTHQDDPNRTKMLFVNGDYRGNITAADVERLRENINRQKERTQ